MGTTVFAQKKYIRDLKKSSDWIHFELVLQRLILNRFKASHVTIIIIKIKNILFKGLKDSEKH